jgi:hypothetical protein
VTRSVSEPHTLKDAVFAMVNSTEREKWEFRNEESVDPWYDYLFFEGCLVARIYRNSRSLEMIPKMVEQLNKHNITIEVGANSENVTN